MINDRQPVLLDDRDDFCEWLVYFHVNAADVGDVKVEVLRMARYLRMNAFLIEYPGYGLFDGKASKDNIEKAARQALKWLRVKYEVESSNVLLVGKSIGTGIAARIAKEMTKAGTPPMGLVLQAGFSSIRKVINDFVPCAGSLLVANFWKNYQTVEFLNDCRVPVLIVHGTHDEIVGFKHAKIITKCNPDILYPLEGVDHNNWTGEENIVPIHEFVTAIRDYRSRRGTAAIHKKLRKKCFACRQPRNSSDDDDDEYMTYIYYTETH